MRMVNPKKPIQGTSTVLLEIFIPAQFHTDRICLKLSNIHPNLILHLDNYLSNKTCFIKNQPRRS